MQKNVKIEKQFEFPSMISEICAISLEQHLLFIQDDLIRGDMVVSGKYKSTMASQIEEDFQFSIPVEITILEDIDSSTANIDIVDFYYQLNDNRMLSCTIEIQIDAVELLDSRECDGDPIEEKEMEIPSIISEIETKEDVTEKEKRHEEIAEVDENQLEENTVEEDHDEEQSMLFNIDLKSESYGTFIVYMVRQNETINSILEKYHTSLEEVEKYNDLKNISMGSKLIIPLLKDENS